MSRLNSQAQVLLLLVILFMVIPTTVESQPDIPLGEMPSDLPQDVNEAFSKLYANDAKLRAFTLVFLGEKVDEYPFVLPYLKGSFGDDALFKWDDVEQRKYGEPSSTPGRIAAKVLAGIGIKIIPDLVEMTSAENYGTIRHNAVRGLSYLKDDDDALDALIKLLAERDSVIRGIVSKAFVDFDNPKVVDPLISALSEEKIIKLRIVMSEALKNKSDSRTLSVFVDILKTYRDNGAVRENAAEGLSYLNDPGIIDTFITALDDHQIEIQRIAIATLIDRRDPRAADSLMKLYQKTKDVDVRIEITNGLKGVADQSLIPFFEEILNDSEQDINLRRNAVEGFKFIKGKDALSPLLKALGDKDLEIRLVAAEAFAELKSPKAILSLLERKEKEEDDEVLDVVKNAIQEIVTDLTSKLTNAKKISIRTKAAKELAKIDFPVVAESLLLALKNEKKIKVRLQILSSLAKMSDTRKTKPLLAILQDQEENIKIRRKASVGLANMKDPEVSTVFVAMLSDKDAGLRKTLASGLVESPVPEAVKPLMAAFAIEKKKSNRILMIEALKKINSPLTRSLFAELLKNKKEVTEIRQHVAEALKEVKDSNLIDLFIGALDDEKSAIRGFAAEGLMANIEDDKVVEPLVNAFTKERLKKTKLKMLKNMKKIKHPLIRELFINVFKNKKESIDIKVAALNGLKNMKDPTLIDIFSEALKHKKKKIRVVAAEALREFNDPVSTESLLIALKNEKILKLRMLLIEMLVGREHPKVFEVLIDVLNNDNEHLKARRAAIDALKSGRDSLVIDSFIVALGDVDLKLREKAVAFLAETPVSRAILPLRLALDREKDEDIRAKLSRALDKNIEPLILDLHSKDLQVRLDIANKLVDLENDYVVSQMLAAIETEKEQSVRVVLSEGLKRIHTPRMLDFFIALSGPGEKNIEVRRNAVEGLNGFINEPKAMEVLIRGIADSDLEIRKTSINFLAKVRSQKIVDVFVEAMKREKAPDLRVPLSEKLKTVEDPDLIELFIPILQNRQEKILVRRNAVIYLAQFMEDTRITEPVLTALSDENLPLRLNAVDALVKSTDIRIVMPLIKVLNQEKNSRVKAKVSKILLRIKDPRAVGVFIKVANNLKESKEVRINALKGLLDVRSKKARKVLLSALDEEDVIIRRVAAGGFQKINDPATVKPLLLIMKMDQDAEVREKISTGLKSIYIPETKKLFLKILNNRSEQSGIRLNAAEALSPFKDQKVIIAFKKVMMKDKDLEVKKIAARSLLGVYDRHLESLFFAALKDRSPDLRYYGVQYFKKMKLVTRKSATRIVGQLQVPFNIKVMTMATMYDQSYIRSEAASYLSSFADQYPSVILFIADLLPDNSQATWGAADPMVTSNPFRLREGLDVTYVGEDAADALSRVGKAAVEVLIENLTLDNVDNHMVGRRNAVRGLAPIDDPRVLPAFLETLKRESDKSIRIQVTSVLKKQNESTLAKVFTDILSDEDEYSEVRLNALEGLRNMRDSSFIPYFVSHLKSEASTFRAMAVEALADIGDARVEESLLSVLLDKDPFLRKTAARAFITISSRKAIEPLKELLGDVDPMVRYNAVLALRSILGEDSIENIVGTLKVPRDIKNSVRRLYSDSPRQRGRAASYLAENGADYPSIIAFLVEILPDKASFEWERDGEVSTTSPGQEAVKALVNMGEIATDPLISALDAERDLSIRQYAAKALGEIPSPLIVEPIIEALKKEQDPYVREHLTKGLKLIADPRSIDVLIKILDNRNEYWPVRYNAAEGLANIPSPKVIPPLIRAFGDKDSVLRAIASAAFITLADERAEKPLMALLDDEYVVVRNNAAEALKNIKGGKRKLRKFATSLMSSLDDLNPDVRLNAVETLRTFKVKESAEKLEDSLRDPIPEIRMKAIEAMAVLRMKDDVLGPLFNTAMYDSDPSVRELAAKKVGAMEPTAVLVKTIEALDSDNLAERESAIVILSYMKRGGYRYLVDMLDSKDTVLRERAVQGLMLVVGNISKAIIPLMEDPRPEVRVLVTRALGETLNGVNTQYLSRALLDKNTSVRKEAAEALGKQKMAPGVPILLAALQDEKKPAVRKKIVIALGELTEVDSKVRLYVEEALTDDALSVRKAAVLTLGEIGSLFSYDLLLTALEDEGKGLQKEAAKALGLLKDRRAVDPLIATLTHADPRIRATAAEALQEITEKDYGEDIEKWNDWTELVDTYEKYEISKIFLFPLVVSVIVLMLI